MRQRRLGAICAWGDQGSRGKDREMWGKIHFQPGSPPGHFQPSCDKSHWMSFRIFIDGLLLCLRKSQHKNHKEQPGWRWYS